MTRPMLIMGVVMLVTGCRGDLLSGVTRGHETLTKPHEAVGGLMLTGESGGDWQINRCDLAGDGTILLSGGDMNKVADVLMNRTSDRNVGRITLKDPKSVVVHTSDGVSLTFHAAECDVLSGKMNGQEQLLTIDCNAGGRDLKGGVRVRQCGG